MTWWGGCGYKAGVGGVGAGRMSGLLLWTGLCGLALLWLSSLAAGRVSRPPLDTPGAIRRGGYPVEEHQVQTADGYLLKFYRIPAPGRPAIFLQHGLACSSRVWVSLRRPLGFLLADRGYDVWLGNARGNKYSNKHTRYNVSQKAFWDFSWHEMGIYDLPAVFEHILEQTGQKQILYVGHSMGIAMLMVLLSIKPEYNKIISYVFALAPAVYVADMRSIPLNFICNFYGPVKLRQWGPQPWWPGVDEVDTFIWERCAPGRSLTNFCYTMYTLFGGPSKDIKLSFLSEVFSEFPTSASMKTFAHFGVNEKGRGFQPFINDVNVNQANVKRPFTEYELRKVTVPVALFYSTEDYAVHPGNVEKLNNTLPRASFLYKVPRVGFNHLDFLFGESAERLIYKQIFRILKSLQN